MFDADTAAIKAEQERELWGSHWTSIPKDELPIGKTNLSLEEKLRRLIISQLSDEQKAFSLSAIREAKAYRKECRQRRKQKPPRVACSDLLTEADKLHAKALGIRL